MKRRQFLALLASAPVALLATACGSPTDGNTDGSTTVLPTSEVTTTTTAPSAITHPTGADEVVLRLSWDGGLVAPGYLFTRLPRLLVTGDGSVFVQGAQTAIYPGPFLPSVLVGRISEAELQAVLVRAQAANLFRTVVYVQPDVGIADAPNAILVLNVNGTTYTHDAYALGIVDPETNPDRLAYSNFVKSLEPLTLGVPDSKPYGAPRFAIRATPADQMPPDDIVPNEVQWPAAAGVRLADAAECKVVEASAVGMVFAEATQITRFVDAGVKYVLAVRPMLPGDPGC